MTGLVDRAVAELHAAVPDGLLVGGCVRDWLLERPIKDLDVAIPNGAEGADEGGDRSAATPGADTIPPLTTERVQKVGRRVASSLGGAFFWLREGMGVARVMLPGAPGLQIDVVPLAGSLDTDLRRRDFTINAMAVRIADGFGDRAAVIDPTGGMVDLTERRLRLAAPDALDRDPLRCLRAFRFRAALGFQFDAGMESALRAAAAGLARISGERIRDELFTLLETPVSTEVVEELLAHDLISPWSPALAESVRGTETEPAEEMSSGLSVARELERWLRDRASKLAACEDLDRTLGSQITPPRSRRALLRLAALASFAGSRVSEIAGILALSSEESRVLARAVAGAQALDAAWPLPGRGRLRFWQRWEPGAVEAVLLAIARAEAVTNTDPGRSDPASYPAMVGSTLPTSPGGALLIDLLDRRLRPKAPLITGSEVMEILGLPPGPDIGQTLQQVEELRADGVILTAEEARKWLRGARG